MKKRILAALAFIVTSQALASPLFEVTADQTTACELNNSTDCRVFKRGYRFESLNWGGHAQIMPGATLPPPDGKGEREVFHFISKDVTPVLDAQGNMTEPTCQWPTGGVMQHAVTDAQGRVYIKRVEVVTKCVNGRMTTIQRALN